jgi:hypothetical protein
MRLFAFAVAVAGTASSAGRLLRGDGGWLEIGLIALLGFALGIEIALRLRTRS